MNPFKNRDIISISDFKREELEWLFKTTDEIIKNPRQYHGMLDGKILAYGFFEPSTRTRLSFEVAMKKLGGKTIGFSQPSITSIKKGETFKDTIKMLDIYGDAILIRHPFDGAAKLAAEISAHPVINCGDGKLQHPTQTMLDIYTMYREFGNIQDLNIGILGDLKYARTVNSLLLGLGLFKPKRIYLISPPLLKPRQFIIDYLKETNTPYKLVQDIKEVLEIIDVLYVVRIQKERFPDPIEYEKIKGSYRISLEMLKKVKENFKIMHPLPKTEEIDPRIDNTKYALYYKQAYYGVFIRMALLLSILSDIS